MSNVPKIIHLMFMPWGKDQKLIADQNNFDHVPYERMKRYAPDFEVKLWGFYATEKLCLEYYPEIWSVALSLPRPMMLVNTLRWLVVYHFGGISWQYDMNPLVPMNQMLPSSGKEVRVFTECILRSEECHIRTSEPIRNGELEEPVRIPSQVFSAVPRHHYIKSVVDFIHERSKAFTFKRDYDCQFMTGNAAASTAYDLFGKDDPAVERVGPIETRQMMKIIYKGTWRMESGVRGPEVRGQGSEARRLLMRFLKCLPGYYWTRPHVHERAFRDARFKVEGSRLQVEGQEIQHSTSNTQHPTPKAQNPEHRTPNTEHQFLGLCEVNASVVDAVATLIRERRFRSVLNYPATHLPGLREALGSDVRYIGGDMVRGGGCDVDEPYVFACAQGGCGGNAKLFRPYWNR